MGSIFSGIEQEGFIGQAILVDCERAHAAT